MADKRHSTKNFPHNFDSKLFSFYSTLPATWSESRFRGRIRFVEHIVLWHHVICNFKIVFVSLYRDAKIKIWKHYFFSLFWTIFVFLFVSLIVFCVPVFECVHMVEITIYVLSFIIAIKHFHVAESMSTFAHRTTTTTTTNTICLFTYVYLCSIDNFMHFEHANLWSRPRYSCRVIKCASWVSLGYSSAPSRPRAVCC